VAKETKNIPSGFLNLQVLLIAVLLLCLHLQSCIYPAFDGNFAYLPVGRQACPAADRKAVDKYTPTSDPSEHSRGINIQGSFGQEPEGIDSTEAVL